MGRQRPVLYDAYSASRVQKAEALARPFKCAGGPRDSSGRQRELPPTPLSRGTHLDLDSHIAGPGPGSRITGRAGGWQGASCARLRPLPCMATTYIVHVTTRSTEDGGAVMRQAIAVEREVRVSAEDDGVRRPVNRDELEEVLTAAIYR